MKSKTLSLFISSDFPPVPGGQSNFLFGLWTHLPPENVVILAPNFRGSDVVDSNLSCRVIRKRWPLGNNFFLKIVKTFFILLYASRIISKLKCGRIHCGQVFSAGFAGFALKKISNVSATLSFEKIFPSSSRQIFLFILL